MIDARLIYYKHYYGWADELIGDLPEPPAWILEIATIRYSPDAVTAVNQFVHSEPFESFDDNEWVDEHIACFFLRHRAGATSWATFLADAGSFSDGYGGRRGCEYFYELLNELDANEYCQQVACRQRAEVEAEYGNAISAIQSLYEKFMEYFRIFVAKER
jgi:hypothetical protein